jgi:hypothetical protein
MYAGYVTNASVERQWREDKEPCSPKASLGEYLGTRFHTIKAKGKEHRQLLIAQKTPNQFIRIPKIDKDIWDRVQDLHPKTLLLSVLKSVGSDDKLPQLFTRMQEDIYQKGIASTPLHLRIALWHNDNDRRGIKVKMELSNIKCLYVPSQKLLKELDPDNLIPAIELWQDVNERADAFEQLIDESNRNYESLSLDELLDVNDSFIMIEARPKTWSVVPAACSCAHCFKMCVCAHNVLLGMCFDQSLKVPTAWEQAEPSMRKARGRRGVGVGRGVAGEKRRMKLLKTIQKEKHDGVKKSTVLRIKGPSHNKVRVFV